MLPLTVARSYLSSVNVYRCLTGIRRAPIVIDNAHYASHYTARPGRARPPPRHAGAAGRRHADHPEARRRLYQRQHPTGLRRRAAAPGRAWRGAAPVNDASLAVYLGTIFVAGRAPATAALAVAAVRFRAKLAGQPAPGGEATARVLGGYRRTAADRGRGRLDAVIAGLLFMGGLRRLEVAALRWADVTDARDGDGVLLTVRTSKTNQEGDAADVRYLKNGPANAILTLRAADAEAVPTDRVIGLSPLQIQRRFTAAARAAGIEARVTAHSGRVGLASELTARGASTTEVMLAGNWKTARMVAHSSAGATAERGAISFSYQSPAPLRGRDARRSTAR